jgi:hypothetical protein
LNESTEKTRYIQKVLALASSSRQCIERLWRIKIDVSRFGDFIAPLFSSIFNTLATAATQLVNYSGTIRELSLTRIMFLPPFDFFFRKATPPEEDLAPIEMGRANVSFLFNVNVARKTARKLTERVATKTPKPALTLAPLLFEAEVVEEGVEEPAKSTYPVFTAVPRAVAGFQRRFGSRIAPSMKGTTSALTIEAPLVSETEFIQEGVEEPAKSTYPVFTAVPRAVADFQTSFKSRIAPSIQSIVSALTLSPLLFEAEVIEEGVEEPAKSAYPVSAAVSPAVGVPPVAATVPPAVSAVPRVVADFQTSFKTKIAPGIKSIRSALQKYGRQTFLPASLLAISKPLVAVPSRFEGLPYHPSVAPPEKAAPQVSFPERPLQVSPTVTSYPHKEMKVEFLTLVSIPLVQFGAGATRSFGYATGLPNVLMQQEIPILTRSTAFPAVSAAPAVESPEFPVSMPVERLRSAVISSRPAVVGLRPDVVGSLESVTKLPSYVFDQKIPILSSLVLSMVSTPKEPLPTIEPAPSYTSAVPSPSVRPSPISSSLKEDAPDLTAWVHNVSKVLRATTLSLSAVPTAASTAEKILTETLTQSVSSVEAPWSLTAPEPDLAPSRPETAGKPVEVEAFKLPQILASLAVGLGQQYSLLSGGTEISETLASAVELTGVAPEETLPLDTIPEVKTFSKLSTVVSLASTKSLIAQRLQEESSMLIGGINVARSLPGETLSGLGAFGPTRTTMVSRMAATSTLLPPRAAPTRWVPPAPQRTSKPSAVRPTVQNTFNLTIAAESTKEDLRDLEKKISRILSDQIRRYYGSTRV